MNEFSKVSLGRLKTCNPKLQKVFNKVITVIDCSILCGVRSKEDQNNMFDKGHSRCEWPDSKHNIVSPEESSWAVDAAPYYREAPHIRWGKQSLYRWYFFGGIVITLANDMGISLRWGGDWDGDTYVKDQHFNDLPHFELI